MSALISPWQIRPGDKRSGLANANSERLIHCGPVRGGMREQVLGSDRVRKDTSLRVFIGDKRTKSGEDCESVLRKSPGGTEHHTEGGCKVCEVCMSVHDVW